MSWVAIIHLVERYDYNYYWGCGSWAAFLASTLGGSTISGGNSGHPLPNHPRAFFCQNWESSLVGTCDIAPSKTTVSSPSPSLWGNHGDQSRRGDSLAMTLNHEVVHMALHISYTKEAILLEDWMGQIPCAKAQKCSATVRRTPVEEVHAMIHPKVNIFQL